MPILSGDKQSNYLFIFGAELHCLLPVPDNRQQIPISKSHTTQSSENLSVVLKGKIRAAVSCTYRHLTQSDRSAFAFRQPNGRISKHLVDV
jgi:hypothetical protein